MANSYVTNQPLHMALFKHFPHQAIRLALAQRVAGNSDDARGILASVL